MARRAIASQRYTNWNFNQHFHILQYKIVNDERYETAIKSMKIVRKHSGDDDTYIIQYVRTHSETVEFTFY